MWPDIPMPGIVQQCHGRKALLSQADQAGRTGACSLQPQAESRIKFPEASGILLLSVPDRCVLV